MTKIQEIADKWGVHCYLECAGAQIPFYTKYGFIEAAERKILNAAGFPDFDDHGGVAIMVRWSTKGDSDENQTK